MSAERHRVDAAGTVHPPAGPDARIVCLVPSITELLCDLGLADRLVGRTGFCIHPWQSVRAIPKVGGTKDVKLDRIRALAPTHAIVNVDENTLQTAEALAQIVDQVIVTHPIEPADNLGLYRLLGAIFHRERAARELCDALQRAVAAVAEGPQRPARDVLYLIWRDPWMTVAPDTYIARTLALVNWRTVPHRADDRYPRVDPPALTGAVDRVLLSSEPFHFHERHIPELLELVPGAEVSLIDGEMTSWYGSRAIAGIRYLADYADRCEAARRGA